MSEKGEKVYRLSEAAKTLGLASSTLRVAISNGKLKGTLKHTELGVPYWEVTESQLNEWNANRKMGRPKKNRTVT